MSKFSNIDTEALRAELHRRDEKEREEQTRLMRAKILEEYGTCPAEFGVTSHTFVFRSDEPIPTGPCGEEFSSYEWNEVRPILQSPPDWPVMLPVPPERAWVIGSEVEITLTCPRGHKTYFQKTVFHKEPLKPLF